jgi:succinate dehydrogenase / fumarate reductase cytochrome b subunit
MFGAIVKDVREALMVGRNTDGKLVRRPLSPHLQIYKPQISSVLSIAHRITGVALSVGTLLMTAWLVAAATSPDAFYNVQAFIFSWFGTLLLFAWSTALFYHFFNGLRHLGWDAGYGYDKSVLSSDDHTTSLGGILLARLGRVYNQSGVVVLIATAVCTVLTWLVVLVGR